MPLLEEVLQKIKPSSEERRDLDRIAKEVVSKIQRLAQSRELECEVLIVGSAARKTWLSGDHDLDVFIGVPEAGSLEGALDIARDVASQHEERYAEHAYVHAIFRGFELDLVPCYLVKDASCILSAVDRTPFHSRYISGRIQGAEDDVLLLKQFMKGARVYGSELRVGGFSGYLAELLVIRYGSFQEVLEGASLWRPGETIDLESHSVLSHEDPLIVVDPVDPKRNVAAALTLDKMFQFAATSRCFLKHPKIEFFFPPAPCPLADKELLESIAKRESFLVLIEFSAPPLVEDVVFPQMRKAEQSIRALLERGGFAVLRSEVDLHPEVDLHQPMPSDGGIVVDLSVDLGETNLKSDSESHKNVARLLFELETESLPVVQKRMGPPIWEGDHVERFLSSHSEILSGPYVENGKVVVETERKHTSPVELIRSGILNLSLGKHVGPQVRRGYKICVDQELLTVKDRDFRVFMARYLSARHNIC